jgi:hypothetical protein
MPASERSVPETLGGWGERGKVEAYGDGSQIWL